MSGGLPNESRRSGSGAGKSLERPRLILALAQQVAGIGPELAIADDASRWPGDLDGLDSIGLAEAEVDARVGGRLVAAAADAPGHAAPAPGDDRDLRPDGVAVRLAAFQAEGQKPAAVAPVVQVSQRLAVREDQHVLSAVIVDVAH